MAAGPAGMISAAEGGLFNDIPVRGPETPRGNDHNSISEFSRGLRPGLQIAEFEIAIFCRFKSARFCSIFQCRAACYAPQDEMP